MQGLVPQWVDQGQEEEKERGKESKGEEGFPRLWLSVCLFVCRLTVNVSEKEATKARLLLLSLPLPLL